MAANISAAAYFSFEDSDSATHARERLLQSGVVAERMPIQTLADEAGPSVRNFALNFEDVARSNDNSVFDKFFTRDDPNESVARQAVRWHASIAHSGLEYRSRSRTSAGVFDGAHTAQIGLFTDRVAC